MPVVLMLAAAAAGALLWSTFNSFRAKDPQRAEQMSHNINSAATIVGAVASVVSILLKALWGTPAPSPSAARPIGELVGN